MQIALKKLFAVMPFLFGIGFIAPLIAQSMTYLHWQTPLQVSGIAFGLIIGGSWGLYATFRGRWI